MNTPKIVFNAVPAFLVIFLGIGYIFAGHYIAALVAFLGLAYFAGQVVIGMCEVEDWE